MNVLSKRVVLDGDDPLFRKAHPVLLNLFCRGVQAAETRWLVLGALISIAASPLGWIFVIFKKAIHIAILVTVWWLLKYYFAEFRTFDFVLLAIGLTAIFYKEIYREILELFLFFIVLITGGRFLRWVCAGYLSGTGFRQKLLTIEPMQRLIGAMQPSIPIQYRDQYDEIMDLYIGSNEPGNEEKLIRELENYNP